MASPEQEKRIKDAIAKIAEGPRSVRIGDITWVMDRLCELGHVVRRTDQKHGYTYRVNELPPFQVCTHNRGQSQLKVGYVMNFLDTMIELGLYED